MTMSKETADALMAQREVMEKSLPEAIRAAQEAAWAEGFEAGWDRGHYESGDTANPYTREAVEERRRAEALARLMGPE